MRLKRIVFLIGLMSLWSHATELQRTGWNLIAICEDMVAADINMSSIEEIQSQSGESIYTGDFASYSNLSTLKAGYGYWVKGEVGTVFESGHATERLVQPLNRAGWNLMGACDTIAQADINVSEIEEIQSQSGQTLYTEDEENVSNLDHLAVGYGYWVRGDQGDLFTAHNGTVLPRALSDRLQVGFGGRGAFPFAEEGTDNAIWITSTRLMMDDTLADNSYFQTHIRNFDAEQFGTLQRHLVKSKYLSFWMTEYWEPTWFSKADIQKAMDAGYIPVFIYWYFGDKLSSIPTGTTLASYYQNNQKVADFFNDLNGTVLFIMEPEFNKDAVLADSESQTAFADIMRQAIVNIEGNVTSCKLYFSLCMTDAGNRGANRTYESCGYENCALGDQYSWSKTEPIYHALADKLSFISFQEMVAQFSRDPSNPGGWSTPNPIVYTEENLGIDYLAERIANFSAYLSETYHKPVFLPYISIATATWTDSNSDGLLTDNEVDKEGWKHVPDIVYGGLDQQRDVLKAKGLFGYLPMALFDDPRHDYDGYQYFMQNEYHLGLIQSGAEDETDRYIYGDLAFKGNALAYIFGSE